MKILYIYGQVVDELGNPDMIQTLKKMGHEVLVYSDKPIPITEILEDVMKELIEFIGEKKIDLVMSIHFVMSAAAASYRTSVRYVSLLWDAPFLEVYNALGREENIWISTFDKIDKERFLAGGIRHVLYQPLCINPERVKKWNRKTDRILQGKRYIHEISFIGRLYENNLYDANISKIPQELLPYFNSIFEDAAFKWDGVNRIYGKTGSEILRYIRMVSPDFPVTNEQDIEDVRWFEVLYLIRKLANIERIAVLNLLAEYYPVALYTDSDSAGDVLRNVTVNPPVLWGNAASLIYAGSKINLNISLKGIEGGTAQRIMDILGAGGFVLTSYCGETAELFEEDKEIVMFKTPEELIEKTDYYLSHDKEREQIAKAGQKKVMSCYTYEKKIKNLFDWLK